MKPSPAKMATRWKPNGAAQPAPAAPYAFPAPVRGWVINENIAAAQTASARRLDNWVPTRTGIRMRRGAELHATIDDDVTALFSHVSGGTRTFFAATADAVFDITTPADPEEAPTAEFTGQTNGEYSAVQFGTTGGQYLYICNGADKPRLFNGSAWTAIDGASTPAITGPTTTTLSHVWVYANRLWFVETGTMSAWALPVDSIGGAATEVSLAGVFKRGGALLFGASWSMDAGDGMDDKCVFVSTEGEVAIYEGIDPSDPNTWAKVGLYEIPKPLGKLASMQSGGDLLIATETGLIPISAAIQEDVAMIEEKALSAPISAYWRSLAGRLTTKGWEIVKVPAENYAIVSQPGGGAFRALCVNTQTGAWSRFVGWDTNCLGYHDGRGYFGTRTGQIYLMEEGGSDGGALYTAIMLGQHDGLGAYGVQKTITQMRPVFENLAPDVFQLTANTDFTEALDPPPNSIGPGRASLWDVALWDADVWDGEPYGEIAANWVPIGVTGFSVAPQLQISCGLTDPPDVQLVSIDVQFRVGALVA
jgi:hypothetical protein